MTPAAAAAALEVLGEDLVCARVELPLEEGGVEHQPCFGAQLDRIAPRLRVGCGVGEGGRPDPRHAAAEHLHCLVRPLEHAHHRVARMDEVDGLLDLRRRQRAVAPEVAARGVGDVGGGAPVRRG